MDATRGTAGRNAGTVTVALAADSAYAMPLTVAASSVVASLDPSLRLRLCVLDMGIDETVRAPVESSLRRPGVDIVWIDSLRDRVAGLPNTWPVITRAGYARIYLPEVLPHVDRVLYLDCDVIARRSVAELFGLELCGALAAGVPDVQSPFLPTGVPHWYETGRSAGELNFNSGVLLMDLAGWRRARMTEALLEYLTGARYLRAQDQEAINAVLGDRILAIDPRWNQQAEIFWTELHHHYDDFLPYDCETLDVLRRDPWIVHFSNQPKPWQFGCTHPFIQEWYAALDGTAFAGWRPRGPSRAQQLVRYWGSRGVRLGRKLASRL